MFRRKAKAKSLAEPSSSKLSAVNQRGRASCPFLQDRRKPTKSIMKYVTADESLHKKYEETRRNSNASLQFSEIEIREYSRTVGDNPSCSSGPPLSISWDYDPNTKVLSIEEYEEQRPERRSHIEMVVPRTVRERMLRKEWDIPQRMIADAVRHNIKIKNQRRATVNNLSKADKVEEIMEAAGKKLMRGLLLKKSTAQQVAELERQCEQAKHLKKQSELNHQMKDEYDVGVGDDDDDGDYLQQHEEMDPTADDDADASPSEDEKDLEEVKHTVPTPTGKENSEQFCPPTMLKKPIIRAVEDSDSDDRQSEGEATAQNGSYHDHRNTKITSVYSRKTESSPSEAFEC